MKRMLLTSLLLLTVAVAADAATITIVNQDGAGEGFNDPTPATPVGGNPGTTIGQQRLNVFQEAADIWGGLLPSNVEIRVQAQFNPQTCTATSAVLGSAGPIEIFRDFPNAPFANTWYHVALANKLADTDLAATNDINITFNSSIDNNPNCLSSNWYYGLDGNEGSDVELLPVVLHEMGHGLGFSEFISSGTGAFFAGSPDVYSQFLFDNTQGLAYTAMSNGQRLTSLTNTGNVAFIGANAVAQVPNFLGGTPKICVNSPGTLPGEITVGLANFGPAPDVAGVTGDVVLVDDGTGTATDGCEAITNDVSGKIALIDRGSCTFVSKALNAQAAGAIAVIIANNQATGAITLGGTDPTVTIPVVSVSQADGDLIKAELGGGVNLTIKEDPSELAGADALGRPLIYTPNPFEGGSSVSHWDVSAFPNLLMEPAINSNLSSSVDLTLAHFADLGWLVLPTAIPDGSAPAPKSALSSYPNPFNPTTTINYELTAAQNIRLRVYDVSGKLVRTLVAGARPAGAGSVTWDGMDADGQRASSGVYFVQLAGEVDVKTMKIVMIK